MHKIKSRRVRSQILTYFIFLVSFKKKNTTVSLKKLSFQKKNVAVEEELDFIDIDDIGN